MNNNRHFDEHIKEQFGNYSPDVPPHIWEKISAEKDKKRPAGFWVSMLNNRGKLLLLGLIVALSSGGTLLYFNQKNNPGAVTASSHETTGSANRNRGQNSNPGNTAPANTAQDVQPLDPITTAASPFNNTAAANQLITQSRTNTTVWVPELYEPNNLNTGTGGRKKNIFTGAGNMLVNTTTPGTEEDTYAETGGSLLGRLTFNAEKMTAKRNSVKQQHPSFNLFEFLPGCPAIEKDAAGNKKYVEWYVGADLAFRNLQDTANSSYLQKRKESTSFKSAFSAGIRYTKVFNNSMSVRTGLNYSQINEKFTYNQGNVVQVTYIINNNGDTVGSYTTTGSRYKTTINRYRSVDIPLLVGYEVGNGKLHANINVGPVINIYSWQKGDVLDAGGNPVSITTGKSNSPYQFKTNAGIGVMGAVSVYYKVNERVHIMAEPYFRYNLTSMNKESITLKQRYHTAGLRVGIRLDLKQRQQK